MNKALLTRAYNTPSKALALITALDTLDKLKEQLDSSAPKLTRVGDNLDGTLELVTEIPPEAP